MVCFEKRTGKVIWKSQNDLASYASPILTKLGGRKQFVTLATERLLGIDPTNGKLLWSESVPTRAFRNVVTPVAVGNSVVAASHSEGMIAMAGKGSAGNAVRKWKDAKLKINLATPVVVGGNLYGFAEKDRFISVNADTGKLNWEERGFGSFYASTLTDGKRMLVLGQMGELVLLSIDPSPIPLHEKNEGINTLLPTEVQFFPALLMSILVVLYPIFLTSLIALDNLLGLEDTASK